MRRLRGDRSRLAVPAAALPILVVLWLTACAGPHSVAGRTYRGKDFARLPTACQLVIGHALG
jgi:hypothetical protein